MTEDLSVLTRKVTPADFILRYGQDPDQVADLRIGDRNGQRALLVLVHGGFWKPEYDRAHLEAMSCALALENWSVLTIEYRRIPGHPDVSLNDLTDALALLPHQVKQHNGRVILVGHSAGGHLALWAATQIIAVPLAGVLALAPVANLEMAHALNLGDGAVKRFLGHPPSLRPDIDPMKCPIPQIPVAIFQGEKDHVVPPEVAKSYCAVFKHTCLQLYPESGHFSFIDPLDGIWLSVIAQLDSFS